MMSNTEQNNSIARENNMNESDFSKFLKKIGKKWQQIWEENQCYEANPDQDKPKFFCTFPYPYCQASLHLGHGYTFLKMDAMARYMRMKGYNVLFPQGFHATGEPIAGLAKRLREGDPRAKQSLLKSGVPEDRLEEFYDPTHIVKHFIPLMIKDLKSIGAALDWRRKFVTTTLTPVYSKFIEWQYLTLKELGHVYQGSHPVIWCPRDQSPTGDHDRLEGEGVSIAEFILLKFAHEDAYLVPATLRPETVFGVTNIYLHPDAKYVKIKVGNEKWIVSNDSLHKFQDQLKDVEVVETLDPRSMFGKYSKNMVTNEDVIILPATFIDPSGGSGVVMSVPAHAPVDWVAIKQLQKNPESLQEFGVTKEQIMSLKPISLIEIEGYGEYPAVEAIENEGIEDQNDPRIKEITKQIYKKEFHLGKCKPIMGKKYAGKIVKDVKEEITEELKSQNKAAVLYDPEDLVICRCGTRCHVKILENQWFLKFSDPHWKQQVREHLKAMKIIPDTARSGFEQTIEWLEDKACARKSGLGTPLPWDPEWIVETLSDSTIYMAYYTIAHYVNQGILKEEHATKKFFDFIFRNIGSLEEISKKTGLSPDVIMNMKNEFEYWYPMDLRCSGKDLIQNHLTFCIYHHVALFPRHQWPRAFHVNGHIRIQGEKMSKSRGIFIPLSEFVETHGADLTRLALLGAGEGLDDANLTEDDLASYQRRLEWFYQRRKQKVTRTTMTHMDYWLQSRIQKHVKAAEQAMQNVQTRTYIRIVLFDLMNDIRWYRQRLGEENLGPAFKEALDVVLRLLVPITPHLCEEIWHEEGNSTFIIDEPFPTPNTELINDKIEMAEKYLQDVLEDMAKIKKVIKIEPTKVELVVAPEWKYLAYQEALKDKKNLMKRLMSQEEFKKHGKIASKYILKLQKQPTIQHLRLDRKEEIDVLNDAKGYIEKIHQCQVIVKIAEEATDNPRAELAEPNRPAITFS